MAKVFKYIKTLAKITTMLNSD